MSAVVAEKAPDFTPLADRRMKVSLDDRRTEGLLVLCFYAGDSSSVCTHQMGDGPGIGRSERQRTQVTFLAGFDFIDREGVGFPARDQHEVETVLGDLDRAL
ncbi:MAG TPA: hypothetical protein VJ827_03085 [Rubrobacter sp.]|nr:hypothetical protein [Rubrobacter sp.]